MLGVGVGVGGSGGGVTGGAVVGGGVGLALATMIVIESPRSSLVPAVGSWLMTIPAGWSLTRVSVSVLNPAASASSSA